MNLHKYVFFKVIVITIQAVTICLNPISVYSNQVSETLTRHTLAPPTAQNELAAVADLEKGYLAYREQLGSDELSAWLPLGLVGAFFRDYLPTKSRKWYRQRYQGFLRDQSAFSRLLMSVTEEGKKIAPIRLDTVIELQRSDISYGINELIANSVDGVLKDRGLWEQLIGQFGEGFFLILKELKESKDPDSRVVLTTSVDEEQAIRAEFRRVEDDYYLRFGIVSEDVQQGTTVRVYRRDFSEKIMVDGREISRQELRNKKIREAFQYNLSMPLTLNGKQQPVNSIDNFAGMAEVFATQPQYLVRDSNVRIRTYADGYEVIDDGCGIDRETFFEQLLIPQSSSHDEEGPEQKADCREEDIREQVRCFYQEPEVAAENIKMEAVLQVAGVCIERFMVKGINIPERMVIELPRWSSVGGDSRNKIVMDEVAVAAFKYLIEEVIARSQGTKRDLLLNGLAGIVREKQRIERELGGLVPGADLERFIYERLRKQDVRAEGEMILPNKEEFLTFSAPAESRIRFLDQALFRFNPKNTFGVDPVTDYRVFERGLYLVDFSSEQQIFQEWGRYIFIDRTLWREAETADKELLDAAKQPEHLENLIRHLEHALSFYISYGPRPARVRFEKERIKEQSSAEDEVTTDPEEEDFDVQKAVAGLLAKHSYPQIHQLTERISGELEKAASPRSCLQELELFLNDLVSFLELAEPLLHDLDWVEVLFGQYRDTLLIEEFSLFNDFGKKQDTLKALIEDIDQSLGYEFNNGRNLKARQRLLQNLIRLNIWHFDLEKIKCFLPFMTGQVLTFLTTDLLAQWYDTLKDQNLETIRRFSQFFDLISPVLTSSAQLERLSTRWQKIFTRYRKHSRRLLELLEEIYPYQSELPTLPGETEKVQGKLDWEQAVEGPEEKVEWVRDVHPIPDSDHFVVQGGRETAIWKREGNRCSKIQTVRGINGEHVKIEAVACSADGRYLAFGDNLGRIMIWRRDGHDYEIIKGMDIVNKTKISALAFSPDGERLYCGGDAGAVYVLENRMSWCDVNVEGVRMLKGGQVQKISFSADGNLLMLVPDARNQTALVRRTQTGYTGIADFTDAPFRAVLSPCENEIVGISKRGQLQVWTMNLNQQGQLDVLMEDGEEEASVSKQVFEGEAEIAAFKISVSGKYIAALEAVEGNRTGVSLWVRVGNRYVRHDQASVLVHGSISDFCFSADEEYLAFAKEEGGIELCDLRVEKYSTLVPQRKVHKFFFSEDSSRIVFIDGDLPHEEQNLRVLELGRKQQQVPAAATGGADWTEVREYPDHKTGLNADDLKTDNVAVTPDGKFILACAGGEMRVWENIDGQLDLKMIVDGVSCAKFSPDGKNLVFGKESGATFISRCDKTMANQREIYDVHKGAVTTIEFSVEGRELFTACDKGTAAFWQIDAPGEVVMTKAIIINRGPKITGAVFGPDGESLIVLMQGENTEFIALNKEGGEYGNPHVWHQVEGNSSQLDMPQFSVEGKRMIVQDRRDSLRVFRNLGSYVYRQTIAFDNMLCPQFIGNGDLLIMGSGLDGKIIVYKWRNGRYGMQEDVDCGPVISALYSSEKQDYVVPVVDDGGLNIWDTRRWEKIKRIPIAVNADIRKVLFTAADKQMVVFWSDVRGDLYAKIIKTAEGKREFVSAEPDWTLATVQSASRVPDGILGVSIPKEGECVAAVLEGDWVHVVQETGPDRNHLGAGRLRAKIHFPRVDAKWEVVARFSSDGTYLAVGNKKNVVIYKRDSEDQYQKDRSLHVSDGPISRLEFSPDGKTLAVLSGGNIELMIQCNKDGCFIYSGKYRGYDDECCFVAFSPDSEYMILPKEDGLLELLQRDEDGHYFMKSILKGHSGIVYDADFSSDGKYLVTAGDDEIARIWDLATLETLKEIPLTGYGSSCRFVLDDYEIILETVELLAVGDRKWNQIIAAGKKRVTETAECHDIPGWRFLQEEVEEGQAPFELQKYLRYLKPEQAEFLVERETADFVEGEEEYSLEDIDLARLILATRLFRNRLGQPEVTLEELEKILAKKDIQGADLVGWQKKISKVVIGQEDSFCLFLRELLQNSRDAIRGARVEKADPEEVDFAGFLGQGFYTLFSDFDEVRVKTGVGDGWIYYLTFVREVDEATGRNVIKISELKRTRQGGEDVVPLPAGEIDVRSYIPQGKNEWIVSVTDPVGMDLQAILNYLLVPDETLKGRERKAVKARKGYWKGTEIQRVKRFAGREEEPQLEALNASEYLSLYGGTISAADAKVYYNRFSADEPGQLINEEKELLSSVNTPQGDLSYYWCRPRRHNRVTHKDLYFRDPQDHAYPDYTEFIPEILHTELYWQGLAIDIPAGMRLVRTRNALADEQKHLLSLKKAMAVGAMKASVYLMIVHGIYLPTLPRDFYRSFSQNFELNLKEKNLEIARLINAGKWNEIPSETFFYLAQQDNFGDLLQVMRNLNVSWTDNEGEEHCMTLEEQRREILAAARSKKRFRDLGYAAWGVNDRTLAEMRDGFSAIQANEAGFDYKYSAEEVERSPLLSVWLRIAELLEEAMNSSWIENGFEYSTKPRSGYAARRHGTIVWDLRAMLDEGMVEILLGIFDSREVKMADAYELFIWTLEETASHEARHLYEYKERARGIFQARDTHQAEKETKGTFAYEQRKLLKGIIANKLHIPGLIRRLQLEFSPEARRARFGTDKWDTDRLIAAARGETITDDLLEQDSDPQGLTEGRTIGKSI